MGPLTPLGRRIGSGVGGRLLAAGAASIVLVACSSEFTTSDPSPAIVAADSSWRDTLMVHDLDTVAVTLGDSTGEHSYLPDGVRWESSDPSVLRVEPIAGGEGSAAGGLRAVWSAVSPGLARVTVTIDQPGISAEPLSRTVLVRQRWQSVSAGWGHVCAIDVRGLLYCWGGSAPVALQGGTPSRVSSLAGTRFSKVVAGSQHNCALEVTRFAVCWGNNIQGELASGPYPDQILVPNPAAGTAAADVADFTFTMCRINPPTTGVYCYGQVDPIITDGVVPPGDNTTVPGEPCITGFGHCAYLPVSWGSADSLSMGSRHLCVIGPASSHQVRCWGDTTLARLSVDSTVPFAQISAGGAHTCARLSVPGDSTVDGGVYCWGLNADGQAGSRPGTTCPHGTAVLACVSSAGPGPQLNGRRLRAIAVSAGGAHTCAITPGGDLYCWGSNRNRQLGVDAVEPCGPSLFYQESEEQDPSASTHLCSSVPLQVKLPEPQANEKFAAVSAGFERSCAITASKGELYCWGWNDGNILGVGSDARPVAGPTLVVEPARP